MRIATLLLFVCVSVNLNAQTSVSRDTLLNNQGEIEISFSISGDFALTELITIHQYGVIGSDTISLFVGSYDVEEDDPSDFSTFSLDAVLGQFSIGIGAFVRGQSLSNVIITKSVGLPEKFIIN